MAGRKTEDERYRRDQVRREKQWEARCRNCGACCGLAEGDPCEHLRGSFEQGTSCAVYGNRFGKHRTVSGRSMRCVPVRKILHQRWPGDEHCGYKNPPIIPA